MQTFLPYWDFRDCARVLDHARLGKQRVEAWQILDILLHPKKKSRWRNHPTVKMWAGYECVLAGYGYQMCEEWIQRGYVDTLQPRFRKVHAKLRQAYITAGKDIPMPPWMCRPVLHRSHRSNLLRKMPAHYRKFWPKLRDDLPYWWPV